MAVNSLSLPIEPLLPEIVAALSTGSRLVLRAPPGAGKTTRVPAALLDAGLAGGKQVVVLEPRRIAARAAAQFVASERGGVPGGDIGYRVRFDQRGGRATRLWFITEGLLSRQLISDPFLEKIGVVVLDEFHERHLHSDVALAAVCELQANVRPDLKLLVMSATLETDRLAAYLGGCPVLTSAGRAFPVDVQYDEVTDVRPLSARVAAAVARTLAAADDGGDVLVFLPGAADIRRAAAALEPLAALHGLLIVPLHGDLPLDAQQRAIQRGMQRKIVLSTNVAETALTIEGVTTVIDSGLAREARVDPQHGINTLRVVAISQAAADQRAGRAGRTQPGRCLRLWPRAHHAQRRARETPEISRLDLSATILELRAWGATDIRGVRWLDPPSPAAVQRAEELLRFLGAVDAATGAITALGQRMLALSVPPRLARILVEAEARGCAAAGALLAALAAERDICLEQRALSGRSSGRAAGPPAAEASDLLARMQLFERAAAQGFTRGVCDALGLDQRTVRAVERARRQLGHTVRCTQPAPTADAETLLRCVLAGFPDRVVRRRASSPGADVRGVMVGGTGVGLAAGSVVRDAELFVAVEIDAGPRHQQAEARVRIASAIRPEWLRELFPTAVHTDCEMVFDPQRDRVVERTRTLFHDLVLGEDTRFDVDARRAGAVLAHMVRQDPRRMVPPGDAEEQLLKRIRFLQRYIPELGLPEDTNELLADAVAELCAGCRSVAEVRRGNLLAALRGRLTSNQQRALDREAPERWRLPSGRMMPVMYEDGKPPAVAARIQELFGLTVTPRLAGNRVPLVIQLLAPNQRPVQITDDLQSFWRRTYPDVRKLLRGRYPKHAWPEDPTTAQPTARRRR